ncbi:peptidyl-prolyl cis-trans isomerase [Piscinibacter koreensis]|uniref:Peptidyl-prolyl cis-trans isomerase n=1 Tax=Piscinibacter koreensis TaxID=2742824 RepID=A0A7Y6NT36_9BURK|nr:peptidylprolyl isomerase [Schlegelella koreensis]NUZ08858.1 peptidyl-prolyl cis-trans isomerase [Schlegelella koreensis]
MPSTTLPRSGVRLPSLERRAAAAPRWLREPLLHFVVLGALLFAVDHLVASQVDDPRSIVIGATVDSQARDLFKASRGRDPDAQELAALRQTWLDNEVLYREGLALQVDRGDPAIRERVIFKALSVVDASLARPEVDDAKLREWFERNRAKYDEPARVDFQEAVLAGDTSEAAVRGFVETLNRGTPGELNAGLRVFKGRPHGNLVDSYGDAFARAIEAAPAGEWRAYATRDGWRAMRLDALVAAKPASFEPLRGVVMHDWIDVTMAEQRTAAVRAMAAKYRVSVEGAR